MIKLLLSDMDGTLLAPGQQVLSPATLSAIQDARNAGLSFGPATGRSFNELLKFFDGHQEFLESGIVCDGAMVAYRDELVYKKPLAHVQLECLQEELQSIEGAYLMVNLRSHLWAHSTPAISMEISSMLWGVLCDDESQFAHIQAELGSHIQCIQMSELPDIDIYNAGVVCEYKDNSSIRAQLAQSASGFEFLSPIPQFFDIVAKGWHKAAGLKMLLQATALKPEEILFFGDAENDISMFEALPYTLAVANATDDIKSRAFAIVPAQEEDGVAQVIEELLANDCDFTKTRWWHA